ncbi:Cyclic nucleotide-binding protein [Azospirillaceae bacterium]
MISSTIAVRYTLYDCLHMKLTVFVALDTHSQALEARVVRAVLKIVILGGVSGVIFSTVPEVAISDVVLIILTQTVFTLEYMLRLWIAPAIVEPLSSSALRARLRWVFSPIGLVDSAAILPIPIALLFHVEPSQATLFGVLWVFKLARYSPGLSVLGRVLQQEWEPLSSVLFAFLVVLLCSSVLMNVIEGSKQPQFFGSIPKSLWWSITTLTTTGYGDVIPSTAFGRVLGSIVMVCGISVFALLSGIIATGFAQEMKRMGFLRTWDLVAHVPIFHDAGPSIIAEVARRLKRRDASAGTVIIRKGDPGDCMYFIVSGEVCVQIEQKPLTLPEGAFFGEIALITGGRRTATAVALKHCTLLKLDIADFREIAAHHPELTEAIRSEAKRRIRELTVHVAPRHDTNPD